MRQNMRIRRFVRVLPVWLLAALASGPAFCGELVVVVSSKSSIVSLSTQQVADIFLAEVGSFPDGSEAIPVDQSVGTPQRNEFYVKVAAKTPPLMKAYWTKLVFTGRGQPPREAGGSAAVRKLVAENPSLIGYIERSALDASVRPVLVVN
jgi:ABC-type phosphate transport system substrate-binding protein